VVGGNEIEIQRKRTILHAKASRWKLTRGRSTWANTKELQVEFRSGKTGKDIKRGEHTGLLEVE